MTDTTDPRLVDGSISDESRRSFLKKGAVATAGTGLVAAGTGSAAAQEDAGDDEDAILGEEKFRVAAFQNDFRSGGRFIITSDVIEYTPNVPQNLGGPLTGYNTHFATYLNTAERFPIFISQEAELEAQFVQEEGFLVDPDEEFGQDEFVQPQVYELMEKFSFYEDTDQIITGFASPLEEDAENAVFAAEGLNTEAEFNEFLF